MLTATSVLSPCDALAVGWNSGIANQTLIERWDGTRWTAVASPSPGTSDAWAVGDYAASPTSELAFGVHCC